MNFERIRTGLLMVLLTGHCLGCATVATRAKRNDLDSPLYTGTRADVGLFGLVVDPPNGEAGYALLLLPFALVDLPFSLVADSLLLPWTVPEHRSERRQKLRTLVSEIERGNLAGVQAVVAGEPDLLRLDLGKGETPLLRAARGENHAVTAWLAGESFREGDVRNLARALDAAVESRRADLAQVLIDSGASASGTGRSAPLLLAARNGDLPMAELLLSRGASPQGAAAGDRSPLHEAAGARRAEMVALLLARGAPVDARDSDGATPLHRAAVGGDVSTVLVLLEHGADPGARTTGGRTPLAEARAWRRNDVVELLRQRGAVE